MVNCIMYKLLPVTFVLLLVLPLYGQQTNRRTRPQRQRPATQQTEQPAQPQQQQQEEYPQQWWYVPEVPKPQQPEEPKVVVYRYGKLPADVLKQVPWFEQLDKDHDGQVSLYEWRLAGLDVNDFKKYDLNDDGFITIEEIQRLMRRFTSTSSETTNGASARQRQSPLRPDPEHERQSSRQETLQPHYPPPLSPQSDPDTPPE